jgi:Ca2+-binding RTX toxin-like protein
MTKQIQWLQHRHKVLVKLLLAAAVSLSLVTALLTLPPSALAVYTGSGGTLNGDAAADTIIIDVSGGNLRHNRFTAGDANFASDLDWDTTVAGEQTRPNSGSITINAGDGNDVITLGSGASPASALAASFTINGGGQTDTLIIDGTNDGTVRTISVGTSITIGSLTVLLSDISNTENLIVNGTNAGNVTVGDTFNLLQTVNIPITLNGNAGRDSFVFSDGVALTQGIINGGLDRDLLNYAAYTTPVTGTLNSAVVNPMTGAPNTASISDFIGGTNNDIVNGNPQANNMDGGPGNDTLNGGTDGADTLTGGLGNDTLIGDSDVLSNTVETDILNGGDGNDTLSGVGGNDTLNGGIGDDTLNGGTENDTLNGDAGIDTLNGDAGIDTLNGGTENDTLNGGAGIDTLNGGTENDTLNGGTENDSLTGSTGNDTYSFSNSWGNDTVTEAAAGGTADSMNFSAVSAPLTIGISSVSVTDGTNTATHSANEIETVVGGSANDTFNVEPSALASHALSINGGPQTTGDVLNFNTTGTTITPTDPNPPSGTITPAGGQTLTYADIEDVNAAVITKNTYLPSIRKGS